MSYYDVDAILTDGEKVPCQFDIDVPYLGHLNNSPALLSGTSLLLPLWLAEILALASTTSPSNSNSNSNTNNSSASAPLTLNLPPCLSARVLAALKADPRAVPLRDQSPHFYGVGARMLDLFDDKAVGAALRRTWVVRGGDVGLHARRAEEGGGGEEFLRGLEEWERGLFRRGHRGVKDVREWMEGVKRS